MKKNIIFFSGAGLSAESGISTFRDSGGLWEKYDISEVATPDAWIRNPDLVTDFYNQRRKQIITTFPNDAHRFIAELDNNFEITVITQNIDDLHERAGSRHVLHLHGNIRLAKSSGPNQEKKLYPIDGWELTKNDVCDDGYRLRPHVVWFGEEVPALNDAIPIIKSADFFIVIGTSLQVYPAAGLIHYAPSTATKVILDPNLDSFSIPSDFIKIKKKSTEAIVDLKKLLKID
ncbi:MAG: NAD-dependent deacylase [Bacteroidetes bacterium]|nr:NAD-dependent deacylase [Bacteroidota bacterium]